MKNNKNWKKIGSGILAVCLITALLLSNQSFGVFAEEESTDHIQVQESQKEESIESEISTEEEKEISEAINESDDANESETETQANDGLYIEENTKAPLKNIENNAASEEDEILEENEDINISLQSEDDTDVITFDLAKGNITFTDNGYAGFDSAGKSITGTHDASNKYEIVQSNQDTATSNTISVGTEKNAVTKQFNIYLTGINICVTSADGCPIYVNSGTNGKVYLILKNQTTNRANINCQDSNKHAAVEKELDSTGLLCIACEEGYKATISDVTKGHKCPENGSCGKLVAYANKANIRESNGAYVSGAGIGSRGSVNGGNVAQDTGEITVSKWLDNITIAGGVISAFGAAGDGGSSGGGAGIGTGSCYNSMDTGPGLKNFDITGGYIIATAGDDSASCIGGGYRSNEINVNIYDGTVIANDRITTLKRVRGTGVGAGGGGTQSGSPSKAIVKIYGGEIIASSQYGAAIGGAGSGNGTGNYTEERAGSQPAYVYIYGGDIQATSTGNGAAIGTGGPFGPTTTGRAGDATVEINGGIVNVQSESGADIGGGGVTSNSTGSNGGNANITISGGTITAKKGGIGGGLAVAGTGGDATILVNGGTVSTPSIGGGNSTSNNAGNAEVNVKKGNLTVNGTIGGGNSESGNGGDASIYVSGGTLDCASIGGGNSVSGTPGSVTSTTQDAGVVVTGGTLKTGTIGGGTNESGEIGFATAEISGGNIQGQFILNNTDTNKKCFFNMSGGTIDNKELGNDKYVKAQSNGGAVYLSDPNGAVNISGGIIQNASAELGGAIYMTTGSFTLSGDATIQKCTANGNSENDTLAQGGAVYLGNGTVTMNGGCIIGSDAKQGGAVYLNDGTVRLLDGTIGIEPSPNKADQGAGVYVAGGQLNVTGAAIMYNTATNGGGAYLASGNMNISNGKISNNTSSENGAGAYLAGGTLNVTGGLINANTATENGGGVFLDTGNMTLSGGRIYSNTSKNGAGAYLKGGNLTVSGGGAFDTNTATSDGGGAYLAGGALKVDSGTFNDNTAVNNGGGAYLAGGTLTMNGGIFDHNKATNGAGAYASDGKVYMFGGNITNNSATQDGGGFYVSSDQKAADVVIRSGTISGNKAGDAASVSTQGNGGAIAVVSNNGNNADHVVIGLRQLHTDLDMTTRVFEPFTYNDDKDQMQHNHASCPNITGNQSTGNGGGIYMASSASILDIYCLLESNNTAAADTTGGSIMSVGGHVNIGDIDEIGHATNTAAAVGNIDIQSPMLVKGGVVNIYGNTENPRFVDRILVDIQANAGQFDDQRYTNTSAGEKNYKVDFFENFKISGVYSGVYISRTYDENDTIVAIGNMYAHEGYKIVGWDTKEDGTGTRYRISDEIASSNDHSAWKGKGDTEALKLYAIWERTSYIVEFQANVTGMSVSGVMAPQSFQYGVKKNLSENSFSVPGKRFTGWNTQADGLGTPYASDYSESQMTNEDGKTVILYAQWVDCTHQSGSKHPGELSYTLDETRHKIIETCDCGGYTASVTINGADVYYDSSAHPATLSYTGTSSTGTLYAGAPTITYAYKANENETTYGDMPNGTTVPKVVGYYQATINVKGKTTSVEYQIKSPAEAATIEAKAVKGQKFDNFNGDANCSVTQEDALTVQFDVQQLNGGANNSSQNEAVWVYKTAPVLTLNEALPAGTTIIMQTDGYYWYCKHPSGTEIALTDFIKMGATTEKFTYDTNAISENQQYRFVIDFSKVAENEMMKAGTLKVGLKYAYTNPSTGGVEDNQAKEQKIDIIIRSKADFKITASQDNATYTVSAPADVADTRWTDKNLVWKITNQGSDNQLPSDAKLILTTTENGKSITSSYTMNVNGEFIMPFTWTDSQSFTFALSSAQEAAGNKTYPLNAAICVGSKSNSTQPVAIEDAQQKVSTNITLTVPAIQTPSLKISGTKRLYSKSDPLNVDIEYENVEGDTLNAVIQKKGENGEYSGTFYSGTINQKGSQSFTLQATDGAGSYRLLITVSGKQSQTLLTVPYYFIVQ